MPVRKGSFINYKPGFCHLNYFISDEERSILVSNSKSANS